jgi:hypothetical protein
MKIICLFVISAVLFFACNRNKDSVMPAERHQANDNVLNQNVNENTNSSEQKNDNNFDELLIENNAEIQKIEAVMDVIYQYSEEINLNGILIHFLEIKNDENLLLSCNVSHEDFSDSSPYYYHVFIRILPEYKIVNYNYRRYKENTAAGIGSGDSEKVDLFDFDPFVNQFKAYLTREGENDNDVDTIIELVSIKKGNIMSRLEQYDSMIIRENGFVINYRKPENKNVTMSLSIHRNTRSLVYYYAIDLRKSFENRISGTFSRYGDPSEAVINKYFSQKILSFDYEIFLNQLREILIENGESEENTEIIINLLSVYRDKILFNMDLL